MYHEILLYRKWYDLVQRNQIFLDENYLRVVSNIDILIYIIWDSYCQVFMNYFLFINKTREKIFSIVNFNEIFFIFRVRMSY